MKLVAEITAAAAKGSYSTDMAAMVQELNTLKQRVAEKKANTKLNSGRMARLQEVAEAISELCPESIAYSDDVARHIIECVRVLSADEIEITFKGGARQKVPLPRQ